MSNVQKPPTQAVGVAGFKADLYASDIKKIDWDILIHLPKFQMYAVEVAEGSYADDGEKPNAQTGSRGYEPVLSIHA